MNVTRRNLFATITASAMTAAAQQAPPSPAADEELQVARERIRRTAETLGSIQIPTETEPACQFKA